MYDIFYVSASNGNDKDWLTLKSRYPLAQRLTNIKSYEEIRSKSFTTMFWVIWDDIELTSFNLLDYKVTKWDDMYVHVFKNSEHYDGICLFPKSLTISQREFSNRFFTDKKEIDIVASIPKGYNRFEITTYDDYLKAVNESSTDMFWAIWSDVDIDINFKFDYKVPKHNSNIVHVFKNSEHYDGICLFPKNTIVSRREFYHRFFTAKKEIDIIASKPKQYTKYSPATFEEYQEITDDMFWLVWPEIIVTDNTIFDLYFSHHNSYDRKENHAFKHVFNNNEIYTNGVVLLSKDKIISQREFKHRFLIEKKEHDRLISKHRVYDVVFISYNEPNADVNYNNLLVKCPRAKRIHGVKGIHQAHIAAAKLCDTEMIWIVDGDAVVNDDFNFDLVMSSYDIDCVHVWRSSNPLNGLEYGYGGVKLLPRQLTLTMDVNSSDMTTSISKKFKAVETVSNITLFNTDKFSTWRSAFRECAKLASRSIQRHLEEETNARLNTWCTIAQGNYSSEALKGACAGRQYGEENKNNPNLLSKINDFDWLNTQFEKTNE